MTLYVALTLCVLYLVVKARARVYGQERLVWWGVHTPCDGRGRVVFLSVFGGAGYVINLYRGKGTRGGYGPWPWIRLRGFTFYLRTQPTTVRSTYRLPEGRRALGRFTVTNNGNAVALFHR